MSAARVPIPHGFLTVAEVSKLLKCTHYHVYALAAKGDLPCIRGWYYYVNKNNRGTHMPVQKIWDQTLVAAYMGKNPPGKATYKHKHMREGILAYAEKTGVQQPSEKVERITPAALALLSRLRRQANSAGYVDGDATDIVLGNPARPADWAHINALAKAGALEWGLDRWDRLTFTLAKEGG